MKVNHKVNMFRKRLQRQRILESPALLRKVDMDAKNAKINLFSTASTDTSVIAFLDLENAFWLASPLAIPETKIQRGIRGSSFAWIVIISGTEVPEPGLIGTSRSTYH